MFKIKICGITTPEDALLAADAGADAIGLNFYEKSRRFTSRAREIVAAAPNLYRVGVFVNPSLPKFKEQMPDRWLSAIQIHGDEPAELYEENALLARSVIYDYIPVIRAFRCPASEFNRVGKYLEKLEQLCCRPTAILVDAHDRVAYGGTGINLDWDRLYAERSVLSGYPLILAGGLTPDNVFEAILTARPDAVDVASGVESSPGKKDPAKVRDFVAAAKEAFATLARSASEG